MRSKAAALTMLAGANLVWASQSVAVKLLSGTLGPLAIALLPFYGITGIGLCLLFASPGFSQRFRAAWSARYEFLLTGIAGQFVAQAGLTVGVTWSLAANGAILSLLIPILTAVLATWLLKERLSALRLASLLLAIYGVRLLSPAQAVHTGGTAGHLLAGNLLIAAGCLGSAFYNVYSKRLLDRFSDLEILLYSYLATTVFSVPVLALYEPDCLERLTHCDASRWVAFVYLSIFLYGVSMVLFLRALRSIDVIVASASMYLVPLFGVVLAVLILHERLDATAVVGSGVVLLAAVLLFRYERAAPQAKISVPSPPETSPPRAWERTPYTRQT